MTINNDKKTRISAALSVNLEKQKRELVKKVENLSLNKDAEDDYEEARAGLKHLILTSNEALEDLLQLSKDSEHPRTYEVLANMIKTTADVTDQLINLQKKRHELDKLNNPDKETGGVKNNTTIFVGSTTELQRLFHTDVSQKTIDVTESD